VIARLIARYLLGPRRGQQKHPTSRVPPAVSNKLPPSQWVGSYTGGRPAGEVGPPRRIPSGAASSSNPVPAPIGREGVVVHRPAGEHECNPGVTHKPIQEGSDLASLHPGALYAAVPNASDYPRGTVWKCNCGTTWVSLGLTGGGLQRGGGYAAPGLEWKRESTRTRRRRESKGITPDGM